MQYREESKWSYYTNLYENRLINTLTAIMIFILFVSGHHAEICHFCTVMNKPRWP
jgi:hypothetical protein